MNYYLLLAILLLSFTSSFAIADTNKPLNGLVSDPFVEAQEKLMYAKGNYKTVKQQERAVQQMRKATRLSLKASRLRANAEKLQNKADMLINKANQQALSRGLYITNPLVPVMAQPPQQAVEQEAKAPSVVPIPGQPINIIVPKQEEVSENPDGFGNNESATINNF